MLVLAVLSLLAAGVLLGRAVLGPSEERQARAALARLDLAAAAEHFDRHLQRHPDDAAAWFLAGRTARRRERYTQAEEALARCQELTGVTDATRLEWDLLRVQRGDLGEVDTRLRLTIGPEHPDAPAVLEALARGYRQADRLREVVQACNLWIACQPDHPWPYRWRADVYERFSKLSEAVADYRRALELAPEDRAVRLALAKTLARAHRSAEAAEQYIQELSRRPEDAEAQIGLAGCRIEQGRFAEAAALLGPLLAAGEPPARALALRGRAALELGDPAAAERFLARAVELAPDDAEALYQLTQALRAQDRAEEANRLTPRLEALRRDLARIEALIRAIDIHPDDPAPRHEAGLLALRLGHADDGVSWLLSAVRLPGDHRASHAALADHFERVGDPRAAEHRHRADLPPAP